MAKLHHATLKAAIAAYAILLTQGKTEDEIKAEIAKDEKAFDAEGIEEIYQAIVNPPAPAPKTYKHVVVKAFRDKDDFTKEHAIGDDVSAFDTDRLNHLISIEHVEKQEVV